MSAENMFENSEKTSQNYSKIKNIHIYFNT